MPACGHIVAPRVARFATSVAGPKWSPKIKASASDIAGAQSARQGGRKAIEDLSIGRSESGPNLAGMLRENS